jgi:hypothetical protein
MELLGVTLIFPRKYLKAKEDNVLVTPEEGMLRKIKLTPNRHPCPQIRGLGEKHVSRE